MFVSIWFLVQDQNWNFPARYRMFKALVMGSPWQEALLLDAWDYLLEQFMAKLVGLWHGCMTTFDRELWETQSGWYVLDEKWCLALGRLGPALCWHFPPDMIQGSCAKRAQKCAKRAWKECVYHLTLLVLTFMTCHVFLKTIFAHGLNRRHGPKRLPRRGVMSLWVACCIMLLQSVPWQLSIAPLSSYMGFISTSDIPCPKLHCWHVLWCNQCCQSWMFEVVFGMLHMH